MSGLRVELLSKRFGSVVALDSATLAVPQGQLLAVLGPSGCGKTTLLRGIAGFVRPDAGCIYVGDRLVSDNRTFVAPEKRNLGLVPQEGALFPHLSVARNIAFGLSRASAAPRVAELLELVGLSGQGARMPHELSGGQQQRVALARALAPRPDVVLLDEPFAALDSGMRAALRADVRAVLVAADATAILVTHDQEEALSTADLVAVMSRGRVTQTDTPEILYQQPVDLETARFLGQSVELPATVAAGVANTVLGGAVVRAPCADGEGVVLVRPEQFQLIDDGVSATIEAITFYGHDAMLEVGVSHVHPGGPPLTVPVRMPAPLRVRLGDQVGLRINGPVNFFPSAPVSDSPS